eukprot:s658_g38.t1
MDGTVEGKGVDDVETQPVTEDAIKAMGQAVQAAMKQLAENPLFMANPTCFGDFIERLVELQNGKANASPAEGATKRPIEDHGPASPRGAGAEVGEIGAGSVQAYKGFWSKFKRPSSGSTPAVPSPPTEPPSGVSAGPSGSIEGSGANVELEKSANDPATAVAEGEVPSGDAPSGDAPPGDAPSGDVASPAVTPKQHEDELQPVPAEAASDMEAMFGDKPMDAGEKKKTFTPDAADVHACLQRKSTVDLQQAVAPAGLSGHTSVVMDLGGVLQDVWVPMSLEQVVAAGMTPSPSERRSTCSTSCAETLKSSPAKPLSEHSAAALDLQIDAHGKMCEVAKAEPDPTQKLGEVAPSTGTTSATPPSAEAMPPPSVPVTPSSANGAATGHLQESKNVVKNSYMRFFRSVNSDRCPPEIAERWKKIKEKGALDFCEIAGPESMRQAAVADMEQHLVALEGARGALEAGLASGADEDTLTPLTQKLVVTVANYKTASGAVKNLMPKAKAKAKAKAVPAPEAAE